MLSHKFVGNCSIVVVVCMILFNADCCGVVFDCFLVFTLISEIDASVVVEAWVVSIGIAHLLDCLILLDLLCGVCIHKCRLVSDAMAGYD